MKITQDNLSDPIDAALTGGSNHLFFDCDQK